MNEETALASQLAATIFAQSPQRDTHPHNAVSSAVRLAFQIIDYVRVEQKRRQPRAEDGDGSIGHAVTEYDPFGDQPSNR